MKKLTLERITKKDEHGVATWHKTMSNSELGTNTSRMVMSAVDRVVNMYFDEGYDVTIYDANL